MKFYKEEIVQKARKLKRKGLASREIAKLLGVGSGNTVLRWCTDIPSKHPYHLHIKRLKDKAKYKGIKSVGKLKINKKDARIFASILYWCEGGKYPANNFITFANSHIGLIKIFLKLFRLGFHPKEEKLRIALQLHTTHNEKEMISFWSKTLKIPRSQFIKSTITKPTKNMKRAGYKGTCTIRYYDVYLLLEIVGIYEEFAKKLMLK